jgi:hypothetical protein
MTSNDPIDENITSLSDEAFVSQFKYPFRLDDLNDCSLSLTSLDDLMSLAQHQSLQYQYEQRFIQSRTDIEILIGLYSKIEQTVIPDIGIYSAKIRAEKIARYRLKRSKRNFRKRLICPSRKSHADRRPRDSGRFICDINHKKKPRMYVGRGRPCQEAKMLKEIFFGK